MRPPGAKHPEHFREHGRLVCGQIDHAVGDHDVDRGIGQRNVLDGALHELDVA